MRFSEKLSILRKNNNLSQEQLADKLNVSRQAVSKWENGSSYPDMEKILTMCTVLNCKLDELMDDGVLGENTSKTDKIDLKAYLDEFLKFITSIYNMFTVMKFKEKIKFLFEQIMNFIIIFIAGFIISSLIHIFFKQLLIWIPAEILSFILNFLRIIVNTTLFILGTLIFHHLFKIRYLNYYITIVDNNVNEKTIEASIEASTKEKRNVIREKIIIRDPNHSKSKFFEFLGKLFVIAFKGIIIIFALPIFFLFTCIVFFIVVSLLHAIYNVIFIHITVFALGFGLCIYIVIEYLYKFIFNQNQSFKKLFYMGITGLVLIGVGSGLTIVKALSMDNAPSEGILKEEKYIDFDKDVLFKNVDNVVLEFVEDDSIDNIKIVIFSPETKSGIMDNYDQNKYFLFVKDRDAIEIYKYIIKNIKANNVSINDDIEVKFQIISNKENLEILQNNHLTKE